MRAREREGHELVVIFFCEARRESDAGRYGWYGWIQIKHMRDWMMGSVRFGNTEYSGGSCVN